MSSIVKYLATLSILPGLQHGWFGRYWDLAPPTETFVFIVLRRHNDIGLACTVLPVGAMLLMMA